MRLLSVGNMYPPHQLGGAEVVWQGWVRHARAAGHDVGVLTTDVRVPGVADVPEPGVHRRLRWYWRDHAFPVLGKRERYRLERHNARVLDALLPEVDAVVWWAMAGMSLGLVERVRRRGIPMVAVLGDYWLTYGPQVDGWLRAWAGVPRAAGAAADWATGLPTRTHLDRGMAYVFVSETVRAGARTTFPELARTEVAHHGPDLSVFRPAPRPPWRGELLVAGRLDERKGVDLAIGALAHLPGATLTIAGGGDPGHERQLRAQAAPLGSRVRWVGRLGRPELAAAMARADALLFPVTWAEPWGLVPSEAMGVGLPVVGSGRGGSGEYLRDGVNALVFDPDDGAAALAARVRELADDAALRERLAAGGLATARGLAAVDFDARVQAVVEREAGARQAASSATSSVTQVR